MKTHQKVLLGAFIAGVATALLIGAATPPLPQYVGRFVGDGAGLTNAGAAASQTPITQNVDYGGFSPYNMGPIWATNSWPFGGIAGDGGGLTNAANAQSLLSPGGAGNRTITFSGNGGDHWLTPIGITALSFTGNGLELTNQPIQIGVSMGDGQNVIWAGAKGYARVPRRMVITGWALLADATNSGVIVDVYRTNAASFPPTSAQSLWASTYVPSMTGTNMTNVSGLSIGLSSGDWLAYQCVGCSNAARATLTIYGVTQ